MNGKDAFSGSKADRARTVDLNDFREVYQMADLNQKLNDLNNTKDITDEMDEKDIQDNKIMAVLAYLSWLVLIPLFAAKDSKFARFHCNQGLVLAICEIVVSIVLGILSAIPFLGFIFSIILALFSLVCFIFSILGIINAVNGRAKELPLIGSYKLLK